MAKKEPLIERFQKLAGIKSLYELNEQQERELQVTANDGTVAIITDPRDIEEFLAGKGTVYGEDQDGAAIELHIDSTLDHQYVTNGSGGNNEIEISLEDLDFETLKNSFPNNYQKEKFTRPQTDEPYYEDAISFPNLDDSMMVIGDSSALEDWKNKVSRRFGNVEIVFNDEGKNWFDKVFVADEEFNAARDEFIRGKMSAMQRDQELGRSID